MNSNEVLEDHNIDASIILSHLTISNKFHDLDAIISNHLGKPSLICSDHALFIGESSTSIVGEVVGFKHSYNINTKPGKPKRDLQPTLALCSPYLKKEGDTTKHVSRLEERVAGSLFLAMRNPREKVYESTNGFVGIRSVMESLIPGCRIHRVYRGGGAEKLDADFLSECTNQKIQLSEMKKQYVCKMLLSDMNLCKASFVTTLEDYDNLSSYKRRRFTLKVIYMKLKAELKK
ncbi:unnamed protein product [Lactuca saligna]|uniref:Uncharacterized protein n=1 Tax=Lactuca saligna TaxID=75948 RepID=A0AA35Z626_LACSI|nr:unnamed protein product [Lactuca saligna]